jgi:hypothetical protein
MHVYALINVYINIPCSNYVIYVILAELMQHITFGTLTRLPAFYEKKYKSDTTIFQFPLFFFSAACFKRIDYINFIDSKKFCLILVKRVSVLFLLKATVMRLMCPVPPQLTRSEENMFDMVHKIISASIT